MKIKSLAFDAAQQKLSKAQAESALRNSMQATVLLYRADAIIQGYHSTRPEVMQVPVFAWSRR